MNFLIKYYYYTIKKQTKLTPSISFSEDLNSSRLTLNGSFT